MYTRLGATSVVLEADPVRVGGLAVHPGDLLHADCNGVSSIPNNIASEVAHAAADFVAAENVILDFLKTGSKDVRGYSEARKECLRLIAELSQRVRARGVTVS